MTNHSAAVEAAKNWYAGKETYSKDITLIVGALADLAAENVRLIELAKYAEKHMRSLARSTYKEFYDADKLYAIEVADKIAAEIAKAAE